MEPFQENILSIGGANAVEMHDKCVSCVYHLCLCGVKSMGPLLSAQPWPPVGVGAEEVRDPSSVPSERGVVDAERFKLENPDVDSIPGKAGSEVSLRRS